MSFNSTQLADAIIFPALEAMDLYSHSASNLLLGTAAQESAFGTFLRQLGTGPALGIYQMEPITYNDIYNNYIAYRPALIDKLVAIGYKEKDSSRLVYDLRYATIMARIHYLRVSEALPDSTDIEGLAIYWKLHYNTPLGAGTVEEFVANYNKYLGE